MEAKSDTLNRLLPISKGTEVGGQEMMDRQMQLKLASAATAASANTEPVNGEEHRKRWTVFQRVQKNRQSRLKQRSRKRTAPPPTEHPCPVCNLSFPPDEIQRHAEQCLRRSNGATNGGDNSSNEDDDDEEYEEYEWAGQKRIRVSSLLQGGYSAIGVGQTTNRNGGQQAGDEEEEEDLNVDEDDTQIYGPSQYGENDVIPPTIEQSDAECDVTSYMRRLLNAPNPRSSRESLENSEITAATQPTDATTTNEANCIPNVAPPPQSTTATKSHPAKHYHQIIESLKAKLRHYENHVQSKFKCLICLDDYRNPAISVSCWHVHCEECWLRSLGARKLCPQCNLITTPKDLRRIYM